MASNMTTTHTDTEVFEEHCTFFSFINHESGRPHIDSKFHAVSKARLLHETVDKHSFSFYNGVVSLMDTARHDRGGMRHE